MKRPYDEAERKEIARVLRSALKAVQAGDIDEAWDLGGIAGQLRSIAAEIAFRAGDDIDETVFRFNESCAITGILYRADVVAARRQFLCEGGK